MREEKATKKSAWGEGIQLLGVMLLGGGIITELIAKEPIYLVVITIGATIFTLGTKIKGR